MTMINPSSYLEEILAHTQKVVEKRKDESNKADLEREAQARTPRGFARALREKAKSGPAIIAELKKGSPSKNQIREYFDVITLAKGLEAAGATALSVLTEEKYFLGHLKNLKMVSSEVSIPCLRKDFIIDRFQILEAKAAGADAILLIAAALDINQLREFKNVARDYALDVLCEVHNREELDKVFNLDFEAYGVNNRNMKTFEVNLQVSEDLFKDLPPACVHVAESGIDSVEALSQLRHSGYQGFLIGEYFMRKDNPGKALKEMLASVSAHEYQTA